ncbi:uncharacterized protein LOC142597593 [Dermatophagoides farinae]|uniref:uncharacterized protein LOC142597593 n=1 Tax=Dermatophagoides farinae TaxID=6954 RepID=UPI003F624605
MEQISEVQEFISTPPPRCVLYNGFYVRYTDNRRRLSYPCKNQIYRINRGQNLTINKQTVYFTKMTNGFTSHIIHDDINCLSHRKHQQKHHLNCHRRIHTGERPYQCSYCKATFTQKLLMNHCFFSPVMFIVIHCFCLSHRKHHLNCHRRIHTGERPYKCSHCNATFTQNSNLIRHCLIHNGERPYQCSHCNDKFRHKHVLNRHIKNKHSDVE